MKEVMKCLVVMLAAAVSVFAASGEPEASDPLDSLGGRPSLPGDVGLWALYRNTSWDVTTPVPVGESRFQGAYPVHISDGTHWIGVKANGEPSECWWGSNQTYAFAGYMYFKAATYTFVTCIDDSALLKIDGVDVVRADSYNATPQFATWTPPNGAGWYPVEIRVGNGSGGYGPISGGIGLGWNTTGYTTYDNSENWQKFIDPGDGSLFRTTPAEPLDFLGGLLHMEESENRLYFDLTAVSALAGGTVSVAFTNDVPTAYVEDGLAWTALPDPLVAGYQALKVVVPDGAKYAAVSAVKDGIRYWTKFVALESLQVIASNLPVAAFDSVSVSDAGVLTAQLTVKHLGGEDSAVATFKVTCPASGRVVETEFTGLTLGTASYALGGLVPDRALKVTVELSNGNGSVEVAVTHDVKVSWDEWDGFGLDLPAGLPFFAKDTVIDPTEGDVLTVKAKLAQAGAGETAAVTFEYGLEADLSDKQTVAFGDYAAAASIEKTVAVQPGQTYYYRLIATGTDGATDVTDIASFVTPAGAVFAGDLSSSFVQNVVTYTIALAELGAGESVDLQIYSGMTEDGLVAGEKKTVTSTEPVTFSVEYPTLTGKVYAKVVASNDCASASWTAATPVKVTELVDNTTYTWKEDVTEGEWTDPANWIPNNDSPYATYPNSGKARANFKNCTGKTTVYVTGSVQVDVIKDEDYNALDLTFKTSPNADEMATINVWATWWDGFGESEITIDGVNFICHDGKYMNIKKLLVTNGATYQSSQEVQHHKGGAVIEVSNKSKWIQADWTLSMNGEDTVFILDDSTYKCDKGNGLIYLARNKDGGGDTLIVRGKHPVFDCGNGISVCSDYQIGNTPLEEMKHTKVIFEIPEGGYEEPPFKRGTFLSGGHLMTDVLVDPASPAFAARKKLSTQLVGTKINKPWIDYEGQVKPERFAFRYEGGTETEPTELWFDFVPTGMMIIYR